MANLDTIFDNIDQYRDNIDDLVNQLKANGITTGEEFLAEMKSQGVPVTPSMRKSVIQKFESGEEDDWNSAVLSNTTEAFQQYLRMYPDGKYADEARANIIRIKSQEDNLLEDSTWAAVNKKDIKALQQYVRDYPTSRYVPEANRMIRKLEEETGIIDIAALETEIKSIETDRTIIDPTQVIYNRIINYINNSRITVEQLLEAIKINNNFISASVVKQLLDDGIITNSDLLSVGITQDFVTKVKSHKPAEILPAALPFNEVMLVPGTEVYFWGIPSSGKTCAVGAILSAIQDGKIVKSCEPETQCKGYAYMTRLSEVFHKDEICLLPPQTQTKNTYEMSMLVEDHENKVHPITCVDLAGELVRCMFKHDAQEMLTTEEEKVLQTLTNILKDNRTDNRKLHFFVIEYGAENRKYEGLPQRTYLQHAVSYIKKTGIFEKNTDAIYLLITKVDKIGLGGKELEQKLTSYISDNYQGFLNGLKKICRDYEINEGKVKIYPFSLGNVCFQDYCKFKDAYVARVIQEIVARSYCYGTGLLSKIRRGFKK